MTAQCVPLDNILGQDKFTIARSHELEMMRRIGNHSVDSAASWSNLRSSTASSAWTTSAPTSSQLLAPTVMPNAGLDLDDPSRASCVSSAHTAWTLTATDPTLFLPPTFIQILPSTAFTLDGNLPDAQKHKLTLENSSTTRHVVFKVKVPNKFRAMYAITPNQGILRPGESLNIRVEVTEAPLVMDTIPLHATRTHVHRFMLQLLNVPDAICNQLEFLDYGEQHRVQSTLWADAAPSAIQETKLTCSLQCTRFACLETAGRAPVPCALSVLPRPRPQFRGTYYLLTNPHSSPVAFKVKSNCHLIAAPASGLLGPNGTIAIHVAPKKDKSPHDRLRIESFALVDVDHHLARDTKRTADDIRRIVLASWSAIELAHKSVQTMFPWDEATAAALPYASSRGLSRHEDTTFTMRTATMRSVMKTLDR
ncbi:Aste57867_23650 [Aphanomyces stellatus]|uniref:Aste57867_23650 protein n=1 Tax=Aphanomyces stellatus TaxID=120398 RepID=A0A485LPC1_9STRA|nr:hypothetical protein As57867_023578 [Aphanomyces stellatus]VFU00295.1 Aste57867_23650 [Aphanomyces stellatus]